MNWKKDTNWKQGTWILLFVGLYALRVATKGPICDPEQVEAQKNRMLGITNGRPYYLNSVMDARLHPKEWYYGYK